MLWLIFLFLVLEGGLSAVDLSTLGQCQHNTTFLWYEPQLLANTSIDDGVNLGAPKCPSSSLNCVLGGFNCSCDPNGAFNGPYCQACTSDADCSSFYGDAVDSENKCFQAIAPQIPNAVTGRCSSAVCTQFVPNNAFYGVIKPNLALQDTSMGKDTEQYVVDMSLSFHSYTTGYRQLNNGTTIENVSSTLIFAFSNISTCIFEIIECPFSAGFPPGFASNITYCLYIRPPSLEQNKGCVVTDSQISFNPNGDWFGVADVINSVFRGQDSSSESVSSFSFVGLLCALPHYETPYSTTGVIECVVPFSARPVQSRSEFLALSSLIMAEMYIGTCMDVYRHLALKQTAPQPLTTDSSICNFRGTYLPCQSTLALYFILLLAPNVFVLSYLGVYCYLFYQFNYSKIYAAKSTGKNHRHRLSVDPTNSNVGNNTMAGEPTTGPIINDNMMTPSLKFSQVSLVLTSKKFVFSRPVDVPILKGINGQINNEVMAIVGPSGAGKTTFIDIMAGRKSIGRIEGEISHLGQSLTKTKLRKKSAYVYQHDVLPSCETAREYLSFQMALRMPHLTMEEIYNDVSGILQIMNLDGVGNTKIGDDFLRGISGGEKRRISIGVALIGNPPFLLMDEPTSGLDSANSRNIIETLATLAESFSRSVIVSVHSPSIAMYQSFRKILFLSRNGDCLFCGPTSDVVLFFLDALKTISSERRSCRSMSSRTHNDVDSVHGNLECSKHDKAAPPSSSIHHQISSERSSNPSIQGGNTEIRALIETFQAIHNDNEKMTTLNIPEAILAMQDFLSDEELKEIASLFAQRTSTQEDKEGEDDENNSDSTFSPPDMEPLSQPNNVATNSNSTSTGTQAVSENDPILENKKTAKFEKRPPPPPPRRPQNGDKDETSLFDDSNDENENIFLFNEEHSSVLRQLHFLGMRHSIALFRHSSRLLLFIGSSTLVGIICGLVYYSLNFSLQGVFNRVGLAFFSIAFFLLFSQI
eukprot:g3380.t1